MEVFIIAAVTANGMIAEKTDQSSLDWTSKEDLRFFVEKTKEAGVMIMGSTTYKTIGKPLPGRLTIVMTRDTTGKEDIEGQLKYTSDTPQEILAELKVKGFQKVPITGGAQIYSLFLDSGLVTDLYLTVEPVLFGEGIPLAEGMDRVDLELVETKPMGDHATMSHYKVK